MQKLNAPTVTKAERQAPVTAWSSGGSAAAACFLSPLRPIGLGTRALVEESEDEVAGAEADCADADQRHLGAAAEVDDRLAEGVVGDA